MTNLKQRLLPELKEYFDSKKYDYPTVIKRIYDNLEKIEFVIDLRYEEVMDLQYACKCLGLLDHSMFDCFKPLEGDKL